MPTGEVVITTAGNLPAKHVIHTVGPVWRHGTDNEAEKLRDCYRNALELAVRNGCKTIAFPAISTGIYGFPLELAAAIASKTAKEFLESHEEIVQVAFVLFTEEDERIFARNCDL